MAIPPTATAQPQPMDPTDVRDYRFDLGANMLETGEHIDAASPDTGLVLSAEAVAAGLTLLETGDYETEIGADYLRIWVEIDEETRDDPMFDGSGVSLPMEFTFATSSTPPRRKQKTLVLKVAHQ